MPCRVCPAVISAHCAGILARPHTRPTVRPFKPDVQSMGRARFCKTTFTKKTNLHKLTERSFYLKTKDLRKGHPLQHRILIQRKSSYDLFEHVQFQEAKGLPSNMPASYHWEPPASTLAHRLAVIHPKNQDALAPRVQCHALCVSRCVGFETTHCRHPSTSPTPGQRYADWTTRPFKPDIQSMGRARFCKTTFTKQQICTNSPKVHPIWKPEISEKDLPCSIDFLSQCKSTCKSSYDLFKHVLFQEVKGLPSNMPASYHWEPPASTLAHRLAVIHPKIRMRRPQGSNAMPCASGPWRPLHIAGILACAPHPANGVRKGPRSANRSVGRAQKAILQADALKCQLLKCKL